MGKLGGGGDKILKKSWQSVNAPNLARFKPKRSQT